MARLFLVLLFLVPYSFALVDPPVDAVSQHNTGMARNAILHINPYGVFERTPSLGDPASFYYVKVLALAPSLNGTVFASRHPSLVWLATEKHEATITVNRRRGCSGTLTVRNFDPEPVTDSISAFYVLDGINGSAKAINETDNLTANPALVPFNNSMPGVSSFSTSMVNFTSRNITIRNPELNVSLNWRFHINYEQQQTYWFVDGDGNCQEETRITYGSIPYSAQDFSSYGVQNDNLAIIPVSPAFLSLDANVTEDVSYEIGALSDITLYKYYLKMDNQIAGACYFYNFSVISDSYGVENITATPAYNLGLLPSDPEAWENYTGQHRAVECMSNVSLLDGSPITGLSHNYSNAYYFSDDFHNLSRGGHKAQLQFYAWSGNSTFVNSSLAVRGQTWLNISAYQENGQAIITCTLFSDGMPLANRPVEITVLNETQDAKTNSAGICTATFSMARPNAAVVAWFKGDGEYAPSTASVALLSIPLVSPQGDILGGNMGLGIILAGLLGLSLLPRVYSTTKSSSIVGERKGVSK